MQEALQSDMKVMGVVLREGAGQLITTEDKVLSYSASPEQFAKLTDQPNPEGILAILHMPAWSKALPEDQPTVLLDSLQDPGNVGAILRVADWFGIRHIVAGPGTVDVFHPKVVRASMGSLFRMNLHSPADLDGFIRRHRSRLVLAELAGDSLADNRPGPQDILVIGNEANGVSNAFLSTPEIRKISIPGGESTESLNAAVAAGIMIWEWRKGAL